MTHEPPSPRWPGWYVDRHDPTRLEHWDGSRWTGRRRPRPSWTLGGDHGLLAARHPSAGHGTGSPFGAEGDPSLVEGPAQLTGAFTHAEGRPTWGVVADGRGAAGRVPHRRRATRNWPPRSVDGHRLAPAEDGGGRPSRPIQMLASSVAIIAVLALAVAGIVGATGSQRVSDPNREVTDVNWLQSANALCTSTLPRLRMTAAEPTIGRAPAQPSGPIIQLANGLDTVAVKLGRLWAAPADQGYIRSWLADWHEFAVLQRRYARDVTPPSDRAAAADALKQSVVAQQAADRFARNNDLAPCLI